MNHSAIKKGVLMPLSVAALLTGPALPAWAAGSGAPGQGQGETSTSVALGAVASPAPQGAADLSMLGTPGGVGLPAPGGTVQAPPAVLRVSVEMAKQKVIDTFQLHITPDMTFNYSFMSGAPDGRRRWNLSWQAAPGQGGPGESYSAAVDADTGAILSYQQWTGKDPVFPPTVTRDQARQTALDLVKRLQPVEAQHITPWPAQDIMGPRGVTGYVFAFARVQEGVPFPSNGFRVVVGTDGELNAYDFVWSTNVLFPDSKPALGQGQADATLANTLQVSAHYIPDPSKWVGVAQVRMVYLANVPVSPVTPGLGYAGSPLVLDASRGQWIDSNGNPAVVPDAPSLVPLMPGGPQVPTFFANPLDERAAEQVARSLSQVSTSATLVTSNLNDGGTGQHPTWSFTFSEGDNRTVNVGVDAMSGEVVSFNSGLPMPLREPAQESSPAVTRDQARQAAIDFLKRVLPNRLGTLVVPGDQPQDGPILFDKSLAGPMIPAGPAIVKPPVSKNYVVNVLHLHQGVIDDLSNVSVSVDKTTGRVTNYYARFADDPGMAINYPAGQPKPSLQAREAYLNTIRMTLAYVQLMQPNGQPGAVRLVYLPVSDTPLLGWDALSGQWLQPFGEGAAPIDLSEIRGHWAEKELTALLQAGILKPINGKVEPDQPMTRGDFVAALMRAVSPYGGPTPVTPSFEDVPSNHPDYPYIEWALQRGWIDAGKQFHPDEPVTRIAMADMVVRERGYQDLTKVAGIFQNPYSDMKGRSERDLADAAVVTGLGLMRGSDGKFLPDDPATRAQAAVVLYRLLELK
ncbi:S-layer homology domain-containing protein [Kyrpidia tusciae]|uniref:S-layer domain protein n=1 Tax=Kyrpidia tusciae (strain DSM 2912 / NBRC 15312 / T2) TaxID=562970 RepID=D5WRE3_KYRT2|nr:S-layer homology domain-containing protein [Kyrpidia tusciae]ADG06873.1 S-layer domain protein [Kyrpidia tusciae DSM 2912]